MNKEWLKVTQQGFRVKRLHVVPTIKENTVGQHTVHALRLVYYLAEKNPECRLDRCILHMLQHDVAEQYTGDVPANFKQNHPEANQQLKHAEKQWEYAHLQDPTLTETEAALCKMADWLQLQEQCIYERQLGNQLIRPVWYNITEYISRHDGMVTVAGARQLFEDNLETWSKADASK